MAKVKVFMDADGEGGSQQMAKVKVFIDTEE